MSIEVIILAAGKGTRMRSAQPKVLQKLAGRPLLGHVINTARSLSSLPIHVVVGYGAELIKQNIQDPDIVWVDQPEQLGTGHAVAQAMPLISKESTVLVLYGDVPLVRSETLRKLIKPATNRLAVLTAQLEDPTGYGRIVRNKKDELIAIVEQSDASSAQLGITEINTGFIAAPASELAHWLTVIGDDNAQGEFYLTDVIALAASDHHPAIGVSVDDTNETLGVNNQCDLAQVERIFQQRQADAMMLLGLNIVDPLRFDLRGRLEFGQDCVIDPNVIIEGQVRLGDRVRIGAYTLLKDCQLGSDVEVLSHCVIDQARIGEQARIGPFARLRPGADLQQQTRVGNFVEIKNSSVQSGSKINHLSYIGDSDLGKDVNIGAGVITCNYDGANKHRTEIGDRVFVGSDCQLVAPVKLGAGATIAAGTTVTKDVDQAALAISRSPQKQIKDWSRPIKQDKQ